MDASSSSEATAGETFYTVENEDFIELYKKVVHLERLETHLNNTIGSKTVKLEGLGLEVFE